MLIQDCSKTSVNGGRWKDQKKLGSNWQSIQASTAAAGGLAFVQSQLIIQGYAVTHGRFCDPDCGSYHSSAGSQELRPNAGRLLLSPNLN